LLLFALQSLSSTGSQIVAQVVFLASTVSESAAASTVATITTADPLIVAYTKQDGSTGYMSAPSASSSIITGSENNGNNDDNELTIALAVCLPLAVLFVVFGVVVWKNHDDKAKAAAATPPAKTLDDDMEPITIRTETVGKATEVDGGMSDDVGKISAQPSRISVV
jgi:hypothetical protein